MNRTVVPLPITGIGTKDRLVMLCPGGESSGEVESCGTVCFLQTRGLGDIEIDPQVFRYLLTLAEGLTKIKRSDQDAPERRDEGKHLQGSR